MSVNIINKICTGSNCYKTGSKIKVKGLMLHSVGCNQPKASVFIDQWNRNVTEVCAHGIIDPDGIYQTLPWEHYGWHAGNPANASYIGVETTEPATIRYTTGANFTDTNPTETKAHIKAVYDNAVELFAYLCKQYKLDPLRKNVIISHNEGRLLGIATAHVDPEHLWTKYGYSMDGFRKAVKAKMTAASTNNTTAAHLYRIRKSWKDSASQIGAYSSLDNAKKACKAGYTVFDDEGKAVYNVSVPTSYTYAKGDKITLKNAKLYTSAGVAVATNSVSGTYYLYDGKLTTGRYRITNAKANCGKTPVGLYVTGWVNKVDIK